ncbi:hypothetical protein [Rhizobium sp. SGZ-381]|uniref:hypothetical protein n=1 Tax=Rhizobium sp. SGZ-381 TaxID=3342800 RepID=UPI00366E2100
MAVRTFTDNSTKNFGIDAKCDAGYRVLAYSGSLGGGTLQVFTKAGDASALVPLADAKLSAAKLDDNGDAIKQMVFVSAGQVHVTLSGATAPNVEVSVE